MLVVGIITLVMIPTTNFVLQISVARQNQNGGNHPLPKVLTCRLGPLLCTRDMFTTGVKIFAVTHQFLLKTREIKVTLKSNDREIQTLSFRQCLNFDFAAIVMDITRLKASLVSTLQDFDTREPGEITNSHTNLCQESKLTEQSHDFHSNLIFSTIVGQVLMSGREAVGSAMPRRITSHYTEGPLPLKINNFTIPLAPII